jgi:hypothetical protein
LHVGSDATALPGAGNQTVIDLGKDQSCHDYQQPNRRYC